MATTLNIGDLIATRTDKGLVGKMIRLGEKVHSIGWARVIWDRVTPGTLEHPDWYWNHIAVYIGQDEVIEALADGLVKSPITKYKQFLILPQPKDDASTERVNALAYALYEWSKKPRYGWLSIVSIAIQLLTPLKLNISWGGAMICSAFGARVWEHAGVIIPVKDTGTVMPSDLVKLVRRDPAV